MTRDAVRLPVRKGALFHPSLHTASAIQTRMIHKFVDTFAARIILYAIKAHRVREGLRVDHSGLLSSPVTCTTDSPRRITSSLALCHLHSTSVSPIDGSMSFYAVTCSHCVRRFHLKREARLHRPDAQALAGRDTETLLGHCPWDRRRTVACGVYRRSACFNGM